MAIKQLPFSNDAESKILGTLFFNPELAHSVSESLSASEFYNEKYQYIYRSIQALSLAKKPFSEEQILIECNKGSDAVEITDLIEMQANFVNKDDLEPYIALVKHHSHQRDLIHKAMRLTNICYDEKDPEKALELAHQLIQEMTKGTSSKAQPIGESVKNAFRYLSDNLKNNSLIKTGFSSLDAIVRGFEPGQFIILAARPSMGKTALGLCLAQNMIKQGIGVGFFSIEMTNEQMALRCLALESDLSMQDIYSYQMFQDVSHWNTLVQAASRLTDMPLFLDDICKTMTEIRTQARRWKNEHGVKVIIVDYLGLIRPTRWRDNRNLEVAELSENLKSLAKELRLPIIVLSQLSRDVEKRMDNRPKLSDLRDSGAIEQDADMVMFLYRDYYYNQNSDPNEAEVLVSKNRNGRTGRALLRFEPETMKFV